MANPNDPVGKPTPPKTPAQPAATPAAAPAPKAATPVATKPLPKPLTPEDRFKAAYGEYGNQIRHFSTVRSSLTTFLLTAGLAAFATNANRTGNSSYLISSGIILMLMAMIVCLIFSWRTEKHVLRYKEMWNWSKDTNQPFPSSHACCSESFYIAIRVLCDPMNWLAAAMIYGTIRLLNVPLDRLPLDRLRLW